MENKKIKKDKTLVEEGKEKVAIESKKMYYITFAITFILSLVLIIAGNKYYINKIKEKDTSFGQSDGMKYYKAKIYDLKTQEISIEDGQEKIVSEKEYIAKEQETIHTLQKKAKEKMDSVEALQEMNEKLQAGELSFEEIDLPELDQTYNRIVFKAEILTGDLKGQVVDARRDNLDDMTTAIVPLEEGDRVILTTIDESVFEQYAAGRMPESDLNSETEAEKTFYFSQYDKTKQYIILFIIFALAILVIGKGKGIATIIALIFTAASIFLVYIPSIIAGTNIYLSTTLVAIYVIFSSLIFLNGLDRKTFSAILGNIGGVIVAGVLMTIASKVFKLSGIVDENSMYFLTIGFVELNLVGMIWAGVLIGSLGAIMDTAMSISSSIREIAENSSEINFKMLFNSGMEVGKDVIGTMTNTLILAYIGSSLTTTILLMIHGKAGQFIYNMEFITIEILNAVIGTMGIIAAVPLTALIAAFLEIKLRTKKQTR